MRSEGVKPTGEVTKPTVETDSVEIAKPTGETKSVEIAKPTVALEFDSDKIHVPPDQVEECRGIVRAIAAANSAIVTAGNAAITRRRELEKSIPRRKLVAQSVKLVTLLCGGVLVLGYVSAYGSYVGGLILFLAIVDYVFGNQQRLLNELEELAGQRAILDIAKGMEAKKIDVLRNVGIKPKETLDLFLTYLQGVLEEINKGTIDLRKRLESREIELAKRLAPPEPTAALSAEGGATKPKG